MPTPPRRRVALFVTCIVDQLYPTIGIMTNPALYRAGGRLASLGTRLLARHGQLSRLPPPLSAWTDTRDLPAFAARSFNQLWEECNRPERDTYD